MQVAPDEVADLNRRMVEAGLAVSGLRTAERGLEDVFFELTTEKEPSHVG